MGCYCCCSHLLLIGIQLSQQKASGDGGGGGDLGLGDLEAWGLGDKETTVIQISCTWWGLRHMEPWRFEGMKNIGKGGRCDMSM